MLSRVRFIFFAQINLTEKVKAAANYMVFQFIMPFTGFKQLTDHVVIQ